MGWAQKLFLFAFILLWLTGCASASGMGLEAEALPSPTAYHSPTPPPPTPTAVVFQLKPTSTLVPTATPFAQNLTTGYGPSNFPPGMNPLTGLMVDDPALLERRPMAIKITNFPRSVRPQWGLTVADHIYEYFLEDGMTRFIGIFYGQDAERVGPVRSGRFFDEHVLRLYRATLTFAMADKRVYTHWMESDFKNRLIVQRPDSCPPLCRIGPDYDYNTLYANTADLSAYITARGTSNERQNLDGFRFEPIDAMRGTPADQLLIHFSRISYHQWSYDRNHQQYFRLQETQEEDDGGPDYAPLIDSLTGKQIAADNLVVLFMPYEQLTETSDTEIYRVGFVGEGPGYVFRNGKGTPIIWKRPALDAMLQLYTANGRLFAFKPGNVWFEILGVNSTSAQAEDGSWRFEFHTP